MATNIIDLRRMLAEKFPAAHQHRRTEGQPGWATGVGRLDDALGGGLARGGITELVGEGVGSGSAQVIHALIERTTADHQWIALVDGGDSFDVDATPAKALERLLWVRCRTVDEAMKSTDLLLRDRNFPLVILDLKQNAAGELRRLPASVWHRLGRIAEHQGTTLLVVTPYPLVGAVTIRIAVRAGLTLDALRRTPMSLRGELAVEIRRVAEGRGQRRGGG